MNLLLSISDTHFYSKAVTGDEDSVSSFLSALFTYSNLNKSPDLNVQAMEKALIEVGFKKLIWEQNNDLVSFNIKPNSFIRYIAKSKIMTFNSPGVHMMYSLQGQFISLIKIQDDKVIQNKKKVTKRSEIIEMLKIDTHPSPVEKKEEAPIAESQPGISMPNKMYSQVSQTTKKQAVNEIARIFEEEEFKEMEEQASLMDE